MDFNERQKKMRELQRGAGFTEDVPSREYKIPAPEYKNVNRPRIQEETEEERAIRLAKWREEFNRQQQIQAELDAEKYGFPGINDMVGQKRSVSGRPMKVEAVDPSELMPEERMPLIPNYGIGVPKKDDED